MPSFPSTALPALACDCHMHVFDASYPTAPGASLCPPPASQDEYTALQNRLGLSRQVLVQPSAYGTDNSLLLDTLGRIASTARGIAVVNEGVTDATLEALDRAGVVGIRFNLVQAGATTLQMLDGLAPRIAELGWHVQLHLLPDDLLRHEQMLAQLNLPVVLDHYARVRYERALDTSMFEAVNALLETGRVWLKLSAPYLATPAGTPHSGLESIIEHWARHTPSQLLWGTDWPHATESEKTDDAALLGWFRQVLGSTAVEQAIFADNPARLYHFESP